MDLSFGGILERFYEDAVARGILFQTECRRAFLQNNRASHCLSFRLRNFLIHDDVTRVVSIAKTEEFWVGYVPLQWALPKDEDESNIKSPGPSKINYFTGTYPDDSISPSLDTLHMAARPENNNHNPLVDIVFHAPYEAHAPDGTKSIRYVEFWISAKNTSDSAPFEAKDDDESSSIFPKSSVLDSCLTNNKLQSSSSLVDHVVHLVITSFKLKDTTFVPEDLDDSSLLGRLSSYSLFFLSPDSQAFENLVSQPIKEAMPLRDETSNWMEKVPLSCPDWKYCRATKRDIITDLVSVVEFTEWRNLCFDEDCSLRLDELDPTLTPLVPENLRGIPFGCVIEAFGVRPFSYNTFHQQYSVLPNSKHGELVKSSRDQDWCQRVFAQLTFGHLLHHDCKFWKALFEHDKKLAGEAWNCKAAEESSLIDRVPAHLRRTIDVAKTIIR